jgi:chitosanase
MNITSKQKSICLHVVNVFETGSVEGDYGAISIYADGPNGMRQVTYGRAQTTEYGNLEELLERYVNSNGLYSLQLKPYLEIIGVTSLVDNRSFKQLLRDAGRKDPLMKLVQDQFFDAVYFIPAIDWMNENGFSLPLSALIIYDSFIHSGCILQFLRKRFPEKTPVNGGDEKKWIRQYVDTRHDWLQSHSNRVLQNTVYRTTCFKKEISRNNWDLSLLPINANGVKVTG